MLLKLLLCNHLGNIGDLYMVTGVNVTDRATYLETLKDTQKISLEDSIKKNTSVSSSNTIEDTYIPCEDCNNTDSSYYSEHLDLTFRFADSIRGFKMVLRDMVIEDYKKQHPDEKVTPTGKGIPALENYLASIDYEKEYEEYKQSRGCNSDEELTALSKTGLNTKEDLIQMTTGFIMSVNVDKYGPIAGQIARSSDLNNLADFFCKFSTSNGDKSYQENILSDLMAKNAQNTPTPEEQAQAMKERYNSSLISKYAS